MSNRSRLSLGIFLLVVFVVETPAQTIEIDPYGGAFFPGKLADVITVEGRGLYGVRAGVGLKHNFEALGNLGYLPRLDLDSTLTPGHAYVWEGQVDYGLPWFHPLYGSVGVGGVTTVSGGGDSFLGTASSNRNTLLSFSYGGGVKVLRKFGPMGYTAEVRARTMADFYGFRLTWIETTAGLTFSWGRQ